MEVDLLPSQYDFMRMECAFPAISGGLGSGKTEGAAWRKIALLLQDKGTHGLFGMPTYDLLRLRMIPCVEGLLDKLGLEYKFNTRDMAHSIEGYGNIYYRSYDRPERWVSFEVAHTTLDELDTLDIKKAKVVWRKATERTRQSCNTINTIANVTTPDHGIHGFTYQRWVADKTDGYELIYADTRDNYHLPDGYVDQIMSNYDSRLAEMYISGQFVSLTDNKVYHYFERGRHHSDRVLGKDDKVLHISADFNVGGCCCVVFVIDSNMPIAVHEFSSYDVQAMITDIKAVCGRRTAIIYPDATGKNATANAPASAITMLKHAGFRVDAPDSNPFIRDRVNAVNKLLSDNTFKINTNKCPNLTFALETQDYDAKGEPEKFNDHPSVDDWVDSMGYFISRKYPIRRKSARIIAR